MALGKLTGDNIQRLKKRWVLYDHLSVVESFRNRKELRHWFNELKNHKVIEIGPGYHPVNELYKCKEYCGVGWGDVSYIKNDGLSFLRIQPDSSAVIVSFGVLEDAVLRSEGYANQLSEEIERVSSPFSIICAFDAMKYMGIPNIKAHSCASSWGGIYLDKHQN